MIEITDRIKKIRNAKGESVSNFADLLEVKESQYRNIEYRKQKLNAELLKKICEKFNVNGHWLLTGIGSMYLNQVDSYMLKERDAEPYHTTPPLNHSEFQSIKLYKASASAGHGSSADNEDYKLLYFRNEWFIERGLAAHNLVAFNVPGDSQEPEIPAGSVVLVDTTDTTVKNEKFYVFNVDGDLLIKEMHLTFDGYIAKSKNKAAGYDDIVLTKDKINTLNIVGRAVRALPDIAL